MAIRSGKFILLVIALLFVFPCLVSGADKADAVLVDKSDAKLYLIKQGIDYVSFPVTFGREPKGHKQQKGDERTPEGHYALGYKNSNSAYYRSIHISYPNARDRETARKLGVDPGGDIMIHGQPNGWEWASTFVQFFNWTNGCIALKNHDMDQVWEAVDPGIPIEIRP